MQLGGEPDLSQEALASHRGGEFRTENLDGYRPVMPEVAGEVDGCHAPAPELVFDVVPLAERLVDGRLDGRHGTPQPGGTAAMWTRRPGYASSAVRTAAVGQGANPPILSTNGGIRCGLPRLPKKA